MGDFLAAAPPPSPLDDGPYTELYVRLASWMDEGGWGEASIALARMAPTPRVYGLCRALPLMEPIPAKPKPKRRPPPLIIDAALARWLN